MPANCATALAVAAPAATFHGSVEGMLTKLKLTDCTVVRARHYGALPDLVARSDLMAVVPQMYANSLVPVIPCASGSWPTTAPLQRAHALASTATTDQAHAVARGDARDLCPLTGGWPHFQRKNRHYGALIKRYLPQTCIKAHFGGTYLPKLTPRISHGSPDSALHRVMDRPTHTGAHSAG